MPGTTPRRGLRYPVASDAPDGAGAFYNLAMDVDAAVPAVAATVAALPAGTFVDQRALVTGTMYRWNGSAWKAWECDWYSVAGALSGTSNNSAISFFYSEMRYVGGRVKYRFALLFNSSGLTAQAQLNLSLPVMPRTGQGSALGAASHTSTIRGRINNQNYVLNGYPSGDGSNQIMYLDGLGSNGQSVATGPNAPATWGQGSQIAGEVEYDPA